MEHPHLAYAPSLDRKRKEDVAVELAASADRVDAATHIDRFAEEGGRAIAAGDWEAYGRLFSNDLVMRVPGLPGVTRGREARVHFVQGILRAFPDAQIQVENSIGQGDWGCIQLQFAGTHTGPLAGPGGEDIPATHKSAQFPYCLVVRFDNGEAVELDEYFDQLDLLTQLGVVS